MASVVDALVAVMETGKRKRKPDPAWLARADTASADARKLLQAVATFNPPTWELGCRFIVAGISTFADVQKRLGVKLPFDLEKSCELGGSYGDITWGFHWDGTKLVFVEVTDKKKVTTYTPARWFANLRKDELARWKAHGMEPSEELVEFLAACGKPVAKPASTSKRTATSGTKRTR